MKKLKRLFITLVAVLMVLTYAPTKVWADGNVAKIGDNEYPTLAEAVSNANDGDTVILLQDTSISSTITINKSITLNGNNKTITGTSNVDVLVVGGTDKTVTIEDLVVTNSSSAAYARAICLYQAYGTKLSLNDCTISSPNYYAINVRGDNTNNTINLKNCAVSGYGALNVWGNGGTINVEGGSLTGVNNNTDAGRGYNGNDFGVIILNDNSGHGYDVTVANTTISASQTKGSHEAIVLYNPNTKNNTVKLNGCTVTRTNAETCPMICEMEGTSGNSTYVKNTTDSSTSVTPVLPNGYYYLAADSEGYQLISNTAVARIGDDYYDDFDEAVATATTGDTITLLQNVDFSTAEAKAWSKNFNLDLNGKTIARTATTGNWKTSTIVYGDSGTRNVTISNGNVNSGVGTGVYIADGTTATLSNLNVTQGYNSSGNHSTLEYSSAIRLTEESNVTVESGTYTGLYAIVVSNSGGNVVVNGGTFNGDLYFANYTSPAGAKKTITINDGYFTGNFANTNKGTLTIKGGYFTADPTSYLASNDYKVVASDVTGYDYKVVKKDYVAQIYETGEKYESLADAIAAVPTGVQTTITMLANETLSSGVTVAAGKNIVLELNGKVISEVLSQSGTSALITNNGTLTIQDNTDTNKDGSGTGKITYQNSNPDTSAVPGYASNTIANQGTLVLESGYIENTTHGGYAAYTVDNLTNGGSYTPVFTMNGGKLYNNYTDAIRMFLNSTSKLNKVVINGGILSSDKASGRVIVIHDPNSKVNLGELDITGGTINGKVNAWSAANAGGVEDQFSEAQYAGISINISDGAIKSLAFDEMADTTKRAEVLQVTGGVYNVSPAEYVTEGYKVVANTDETTKDDFPFAVVVANYVAQIGNEKYETLAEAVTAVKNLASSERTTITLLADTNEVPVIDFTYPVQINGNGHKIGLGGATYAMQIATNGADVIVDNVEVGSLSVGRGIEVAASNVTLLVQNGSTVYGSSYPINVYDRLGNGVNNNNITITGSTVQGYCALNLWGTNGTLTVNNSTLSGTNNSTYTSTRGYNGNDFGVIAFESAGTSSGNKASGWNVVVTDSTINATQTTGNHEAVVLFNPYSTNNTVKLNGCTVTRTNAETCPVLEDLQGTTGNKVYVKNTNDSATSAIPVLPNGYHYLAADSEGYQLISNTAVARIGDDKYETLDAAAAAATAGDTIILLDDITFGTDRSVPVWEKNFNIDLNGHTLTTNSNQGVNQSNNGYTASAICFGDTTVTAYTRNNIITNGTIKTAYGAGVYLDGPKSTTVLSGLTINQNYPNNVQTTDEYSAAVRLTGNATAIIESGTYSGKNAIAVSNSGGDVTINDGTFTGSIFFNIGGDASAKKITINGGTFVANDSEELFVNPSKGTLVIKGGTFDHDPTAYVAPGYVAQYDDDNATWTVVENTHTHVYDNEHVVWRNIRGELTAIFTYYCSCGDFETEIVTPTFVDNAGIRTYTAESVLYDGVVATTTKTLNYTVKLNNITVGTAYNWGDVCTLTAGEGNYMKWYLKGNEDVVFADGTDTYTFPVTGSIDIANKESEHVGQQAVVSASLTSTEAGKASFQAKWSIPTGNTVTSVKIYRGYSIADKDVPAASLIERGTTRDINLKVINGDYKLNLRGLTSGTYQHAVIEITYYDGNEYHILTSTVQKVQVAS